MGGWFGEGRDGGPELVIRGEHPWLVSSRQAACPQEGRRPVTGWHEDAVGRARMQVHMVIERRSEAVQKGDGAESRASYARPVAGTGRARRCPLGSADGLTGVSVIAAISS